MALYSCHSLSVTHTPGPLCLLSLPQYASSSIIHLRAILFHPPVPPVSYEPTCAHLCHLCHLCLTVLTCAHLCHLNPPVPPVLTCACVHRAHLSLSVLTPHLCSWYPTPHLHLETPPQAGCTREACSAHPEIGKRSSGAALCPPTQNLHSALSQTSGALTWLGVHRNAPLRSSLCKHPLPRSVSTHTLAAQTSPPPCGSSHSQAQPGSAGQPASQAPALSTLLRWRQRPLPLSCCSAHADLPSSYPSFLPHGWHNDRDSPVHSRGSGVCTSCSTGLLVWLIATGSPKKKGGHTRTGDVAASASLICLSEGGWVLLG